MACTESSVSSHEGVRSSIQSYICAQATWNIGEKAPKVPCQLHADIGSWIDSLDKGSRESGEVVGHGMGWPQCCKYFMGVDRDIPERECRTLTRMYEFLSLILEFVSLLSKSYAGDVEPLTTSARRC